MPDAAGPTSMPDAALGAAAQCFVGLGNPNQPKPDYDQFQPVVGTHCAGTNHQTIGAVERLVFLGDSITAGTPPTYPWQFYRYRLADALRATYPDLDVDECAAWGARAGDLAAQIAECFPTTEAKRTLVVMTIGGNDMNAFLEEAADGDTPAQTLAKVDAMLATLETAIRTLKDPVRFPAGSSVVFTNIYEFTDGTGDLESCPGAVLAGFDSAAAAQMRPAMVHADEQYMRIAVDTATDMVFLLESFCGHGFHAGEASNECYRGPTAETWFDLTCIHPTPTGHAAMADLIEATIRE